MAGEASTFATTNLGPDLPDKMLLTEPYLESDGGVGKQDLASRIFSIKTAVSTFQHLVDTLGTIKDWRELPDIRKKLRKTRLHVGQLVKDTSAYLKLPIETYHIIEEENELAKDFHAQLMEFQKALRLAAERETASPPFSPYRFFFQALRLGDSEEEILKQVALLNEARRARIAFDEEREQGIQEIHQQIGEVNDIFKDLAEPTKLRDGF